jgi:hypothetical protein
MNFRLAAVSDWTTMSFMRATRLFVLWAVLLTLPIYGMAAVAQRSCQEQMTASSQGAQASDCCPGKADQDTPCKRLGDGPLGKKGSCTACKAGYNCKSPQSFEPTSSFVLLMRPVTSTASADPHEPLTSVSPDGLWRPPTYT